MSRTASLIVNPFFNSVANRQKRPGRSQSSAVSGFVAALLLIAVFTSCSRTDYYDILSSRKINSVVFSSEHNEALGIDVEALPDETGLSYTAIMPRGVLPETEPGLELVPVFDIDGFALFIGGTRQTNGLSSVALTNGTVIDYKLYSYDGKSTGYTMRTKNADAWFSSFGFDAVHNAALMTCGGGSITLGESDIEGNVIWFDLPHAVSLKGLVSSFTSEPGGVRVCFVDGEKKEFDQTSGLSARDYSDYCVYRVYDVRGETFLDYKVSAYRLDYLSFRGYEDILSSDGAHLSDDTIRVELAHGTNISSLKPVFTYKGDAITFNGRTISSGEVALDFSDSIVNPLEIEVSTKGGRIKRYNLSVSTAAGPGVAPVNPPNDPVLPDGSATESGKPAVPQDPQVPQEPDDVYTVNFNSNGGSAVASQSVFHGNSATRPDDPVKTGHTFVNWYADAACTIVFSFSAVITSNQTLFAKWLPKSYNLTFHSNVYNETTGTQSFIFGQTLNLTQYSSSFGVPKGFDHFAGWASSPTGAVIYNNGAAYTMNTESAHLYAKWNDSAAQAPAQPEIKTITVTSESITVEMDNYDKSLKRLTLVVDPGAIRVSLPYPFVTNKIEANSLSAETEYFCTLITKDDFSESPIETFRLTTAAAGSTQVYKTIYYEDQLYTLAVSAESNVRAGNYILMRDLDLDSYPNWTPIGSSTDPFTGIFEGSGRVVTGLTINSANWYCALFGKIGNYSDPAEIRNLGVVSCAVSGGRFSAALAAYVFLQSKIINCYSSGDIENIASDSDGFAGGLVGSSVASTIVNSHSNCSIETTTGAGKIGGLAGFSNGSIKNCYATGEVIVNGNYAGGLIGCNEGKITDSYATGNVTVIDPAYTHLGGLVGDNNTAPAIIDKCYSAGFVYDNSTANRGGLVGSQSGGTTTNSNYYRDPENGFGTKKSINQMRDKANYSGWDFSDTWAISPALNNGFPYLRSDEKRKGLALEALFTNSYLSGATNTGATQTADRKGNANSAFSFNGSVTSNINFGSSMASMFDDDKAYSLSLWCRPTAAGVANALIATQNGLADNLEYGIYFNADNKFEVQVNKSGWSAINTLTNPNDSPINNWHHLVMVFDPAQTASELRFYVNGALVAQSDYSAGDLDAAAGDFWLGSLGGANTTDYTGYIDDVRVYERALSAREVTVLYYE